LAQRPRESQSERRRRQREEQRQEEAFSRARNAERSYGAQLQALARHIRRIIEAFAPEDPDETWEPGDLARLDAALGDYSEAIDPWAQSTAERMITEVNRRNLTAWRQHTQGMGAALQREIEQAPTGERMAEVLAEQVRLIKSLPREAAQRVHEKTIEAIEAGHRYGERTALELGWDPEAKEWKRGLPPRSELVEALAAANDPKRTEQWLRNRATLIARTETARTASVLVQARAEHIGAESYIWKTAGDWKVRPTHRKLNGTVHRWDDPPLSDLPDYHSHPGQIFNCRCVALPIIPE
jgi:SPP1 gp7 family putative phage head morphogenesis protein